MTIDKNFYQFLNSRVLASTLNDAFRKDDYFKSFKCSASLKTGIITIRDLEDENKILIQGVPKTHLADDVRYITSYTFYDPEIKQTVGVGRAVYGKADLNYDKNPYTIAVKEIKEMIKDVDERRQLRIER